MSGKTHLEFYRQHYIAPVRYDLSDMQAHFERRRSLYLKLALPPLAFRAARILEVAAGVGHNSLYLAQLSPKKLTLLEPNEAAIEQIHLTYSAFKGIHTSPEVLTAKLEDYFPDHQFDIVLCENWLGTSEHELSLLRKLARMVAPKGVLVITTVSPIGFVPNLLRRFLAVYIAPINEAFEKRTLTLVESFGCHLDTLKSMTRSKIDWIHDNMINSAYFGIALSIPRAIETLGNDFEVMGSSPSFAEDWRWFKALHGPHKNTNQHFLLEYWKKAHNFLDYRMSSTTRKDTLNMALEHKALLLLTAIEEHEEAHIQGREIKEKRNIVLACLEEFLGFVPQDCHAPLVALREVKEQIQKMNGDVSLEHLAHFSSLFGRETTYLSFYRC